MSRLCMTAAPAQVNFISGMQISHQIGKNVLGIALAAACRDDGVSYAEQS